jgi:hypothetical protein
MFLRMTQSEIIFAMRESPEGGYEAHALGHPIFTQADSLEELKTMLRDAVTCHFAEAEKPSVIRLHMVKDEVSLRLPRDLSGEELSESTATKVTRQTADASFEVAQLRSSEAKSVETL